MVSPVGRRVEEYSGWSSIFSVIVFTSCLPPPCFENGGAMAHLNSTPVSQRWLERTRNPKMEEVLGQRTGLDQFPNLPG